MLTLREILPEIVHGVYVRCDLLYTVLALSTGRTSVFLNQVAEYDEPNYSSRPENTSTMHIISSIHYPHPKPNPPSPFLVSRPQVRSPPPLRTPHSELNGPSYCEIQTRSSSSPPNRIFRPYVPVMGSKSSAPVPAPAPKSEEWLKLDLEVEEKEVEEKEVEVWLWAVGTVQVHWVTVRA